MRWVLAVDVLHDSAAKTVEQAASWATKLGATLDLAFVDEYQYSAFLIRDPTVRDLVVAQWEQVRQSHRTALADLMSQVPEASRGEIRFLEGRAHEQLLEICDEYDGLLVATRGRTGLSHFILGSVAERLARFAPIPVVILRLDEAKGRS